MTIKRLLPALLAASIMGSPGLKAAESDPIFLGAQGRLVIPHLILGNDIYFVILDRTHPQAYNFALDGASVTKITPQPGDDWATAAEVIGDWTIQELPGVTLSISASGAYTVATPADEDCVAGAESGTWSLDEDTGVFFARALSDTNGECGFSHPDGAIQLKRVGANLIAVLHEEENGMQQVMEITLLPD